MRNSAAGSAGRTLQDAFREAARQNQAIAFLVCEAEQPKKRDRRAEYRTRRAAERAQQIEEQIAAARKEVSTMGENYNDKPEGNDKAEAKGPRNAQAEVPEKTPEKTPEEPGNLSGGEQSNGPVKG